MVGIVDSGGTLSAIRFGTIIQILFGEVAVFIELGHTDFIPVYTQLASDTDLLYEPCSHISMQD